MTAEVLSRIIRERRSIRRFSQTPVDSGIIEKIFDDLRFMPSPTNRPCFRFISLEDRLKIEAMRQEIITEVEETAQKLGRDDAENFRKYSDFFTFFSKAPLTIIGLYRNFVSRLPSGGPNSHAIQGLTEVQAFGGSVAALLLSLHAHGIGSCWMTGPLIAERRILKIFEIEVPWRLGAVIPVGYTDEKPGCPAKPKLTRIFSKC